MKWTLVFLAALAVANGYGPGVRVKFSVGFDFGGSFFYRVGTTEDEVAQDGYSIYERPNDGHLPQLTMWCPEDRTVCVLFDDTGYIAGLQVALREDEFTNKIFEFADQGFTSWVTEVDGVETTFWTLQQFFVDEEFLKQSPEDRIANRKDDTLLQAGGVWLVGPDGLLKVSDAEDETNSNSIFTRQACIPWMGRHYYYNMSSNTECTAKQMYPWFPLYNNEELIAHGFIVFGDLTPSDPNRRDWFERPPRFAVETIVPRGPNCLYELSSSPGVLTMHIYYKDDPREVGFCLW